MTPDWTYVICIMYTRVVPTAREIAMRIQFLYFELQPTAVSRMCPGGAEAVNSHFRPKTD